MIRRDLWEMIERLEEQRGAKGQGEDVHSEQLEDFFFLLGKIPAGPITQQKQEVQHSV